MIERTPELPESSTRPDVRFVETKRIRRWSLAAAGIFAGLSTVCLFVVPQSYKARLSLSLASATGAGASTGLLASISGMGTSPNTKYVGVLRSRGFAEQVARHINLQRLYHQPTAEDSVEAMMDSVVVADNPKDGLLYVDVSLYGPPRFALNSRSRKEAVRSAAATAANHYGDLLRRYITTEDIDTDGILLKAASEQLSKARVDYDASVARLAGFVRTHSVQAGDISLAAKDSGTPGAEAMAKELETLYTEKATLQSDIVATDAARSVGKRLQADQLRNLGSLPSEDPLLTQARAAVTAIHGSLDNERVLLGPDHPTVVADQERLKLAEDRLHQQSGAVKQGLTTLTVDSEMHLQGMKTKDAAISRQIDIVEHKAQTSKEMAMDFEQRRSEVMLRMEVLKTVWTQTAALSLQVVSAQNRVKVVDTALASRKGSPNLIMFSFICVLITAALMAAWIHFEYRAFLRVTARRRLALSVAGS